MKVISQDAATTLSQLVEQAEHGDEVIIARAGRPVARVVAIREPQPQRTGRRTLGQWSGLVRMSDDFDAPLPEAELAAWYGERE